MLLWSVQENAILYPSSSVIQLYKCEQWPGSWSSANKRTHLFSEKCSKKQLFPTFDAFTPWLFFLKIIPWVCVGERNSFKLTKMDTFLHGLQWYRFGSTVLRPWASCIPLRPATILKAPWWCHRMMWVWSFFDCGVHVTYINLPALYMEQSWAIYLMCTFTKLWSIM